MQVACLELDREGLKMAEFGSGQVKAQAKGVHIIMRRTLFFIQAVIKDYWSRGYRNRTVCVTGVAGV